MTIQRNRSTRVVIMRVKYSTVQYSSSGTNKDAKYCVYLVWIYHPLPTVTTDYFSPCQGFLGKEYSDGAQHTL
jgi:hypothetical protein